MSKPLNIYFSEKGYETRGLYEIFKAGQPTGELIPVTTIKRMLTRSQFKAFMSGDQIFELTREQYKLRNGDDLKRRSNKTSSF